jgi:hypothetical protein
LFSTVLTSSTLTDVASALAASSALAAASSAALASAASLSRIALGFHCNMNYSEQRPKDQIKRIICKKNVKRNKETKEQHN